MHPADLGFVRACFACFCGLAGPVLAAVIGKGVRLGCRGVCVLALELVASVCTYIFVRSCEIQSQAHLGVSVNQPIQY